MDKKLNKIIEKLENEGIIFDESLQSKIKERRVRLNCNRVIDIGVNNDDFDRWANSTEMSFDVMTKTGLRKFIEWCKND